MENEKEENVELKTRDWFGFILPAGLLVVSAVVFTLSEIL